MLSVPRTAERADRNAVRAAAACVNEQTVADIDAGMSDPCCTRIGEKYEIAGQKLALRDRCAA